MVLHGSSRWRCMLASLPHFSCSSDAHARLHGLRDAARGCGNQPAHDRRSPTCATRRIRSSGRIETVRFRRLFGSEAPVLHGVNCTSARNGWHPGRDWINKTRSWRYPRFARRKAWSAAIGTTRARSTGAVAPASRDRLQENFLFSVHPREYCSPDATDAEVERPPYADIHDFVASWSTIPDARWRARADAIRRPAAALAARLLTDAHPLGDCTSSLIRTSTASRRAWPPMAGRTTFIIAMALFRGTRRPIFVLENSVIVEEGAPDKLLRNPIASSPASSFESRREALDNRLPASASG